MKPSWPSGPQRNMKMEYRQGLKSQIPNKFQIQNSKNQTIFAKILNFLRESLLKIFGDFTEKSVGKRMAVVLDGEVYTAPNIVQ
ncbi:MAG TPA: hypothetical protein EYP21_03575, partial [Syntrophaceae bacterium]|nr:hypothetical protein [Syntrophaceae bacterium]